MVDRNARYGVCFDRFEYLMGLLVTHLRLIEREGEPLVPPAYVGRIRWRHQRPSPSPVAEWADAHAEKIAPQLLGSADNAMAAWKAAKAAYDELVDEARRHTLFA